MALAGEEETNPSWQKSFDVSGRVQNRGGSNRLERGDRKTKFLSWRKACGLIRSRCRRGSGVEFLDWQGFADRQESRIETEADR